MKSLPTGVAFALCLLSITAQAADQTPKVVYKAPPPATLPAGTGMGYGDWSGFYVGINGGGANLIGGTFGYNFQTGALVLGVEGDLDTAWSSVGPTPYLGTLRGRLGFAFNQFMPYFTGGYAFSGSNASGSAVGGGMEWRMTPTMSLKAEYLRIDLDRSSSFLPSGADNIVRVGLNWRLGNNFLGGPLVARY